MATEVRTPLVEKNKNALVKTGKITLTMRTDSAVQSGVDGTGLDRMSDDTQLEESGDYGVDGISAGST